MIRSPSTLIPLFLVLPVVLAACADSAAPGEAPVTDGLPYDLTRPAAQHVLPLDLQEVSGLTAIDSHHVAAVQDERGSAFVIDTRAGTVTAPYPFDGPGDYEDLALSGDTLHVLRSDGRLFSVGGWRGDTPPVTHVDLPLGAGCDAEGLAADGDRLLVACKTRHVVYAYAPVRTALDTLFVFDDPARMSAVRDRSRLRRRLRHLFGTDRSTFRPSAVARLPGTDEFWILSGEPPALAVVTGDGTLRTVVALPRERFPQPEALTFLPGGDLVVASEGRGAGRALLYRFRRSDAIYD